MTFLSREDAEIACGAEHDAFEQADELLQDARENLEQAREKLEDETSVFDESTWADGVAIGGAVLGCLAPGVGWGLCGGALVVGGFGFLLSEDDRVDEIEEAHNALEDAEQALEIAEMLWADRFLDYSGCLLHHMSKGGDDGDGEPGD